MTATTAEPSTQLAEHSPTVAILNELASRDETPYFIATDDVVIMIRPEWMSPESWLTATALLSGYWCELLSDIIDG